jgi:hypothetical protein
VPGNDFLKIREVCPLHAKARRLAGQWVCGSRGQIKQSTPSTPDKILFLKLCQDSLKKTFDVGIVATRADIVQPAIIPPVVGQDSPPISIRKKGMGIVISTIARNDRVNFTHRPHGGVLDPVSFDDRFCVR